MTLILIILIVLLLAGGGYGWHAGYYGGPAGWSNPIGVVLLIVIVLLILGALGGPRLGWW